MRHWPLDLALLAVCLCLAPSRYQAGDPNASLAAAETISFQPSFGSPQSTDLAELARTDVIAFLERCLARYQAEVESYTCILAKQERLDGKLRDPEIIRCAFKEKPFSVHMRWIEGKDQAEATLYIQGDNDNNVLIRPANAIQQKGLQLVGKYCVERPPDDRQVRGSSRYSMKEFGLERGLQRIYRAWKAAQERGTLRVEYLGLQRIPEAENRFCHVVRRYCDPPEEEGLTDVTIAIDAETWLLVGSVLRAGDGLIGRYNFRDIQLNPRFPRNQFKPEILKP